MSVKETPRKGGFTNKRCPKCGGNVFLDRDFDGWYEQCLQCGHMSYLPNLLNAEATTNKRPVAQADKYAIAHN